MLGVCAAEAHNSRLCAVWRHKGRYLRLPMRRYEDLAKPRSAQRIAPAAVLVVPKQRKVILGLCATDVVLVFSGEGLDELTRDKRCGGTGALH